MDLGISGRRAIVCASSKGLGRACAEALLAEGVREVVAVVADVTTSAGRSALLAACPDPDILINNNAEPDPGPFLAIDEEHWLESLAANMVAPLQLVRAVMPAMIARKFGRIVNITSAMVTTPRTNMALSSGPRAGLTAALKGLSFELVPHNVTINNLLPERFDTDRQLQMANAAMAAQHIDFAEARRRQVQAIAAKRLGRPPRNRSLSLPRSRRGPNARGPAVLGGAQALAAVGIVMRGRDRRGDPHASGDRRQERRRGRHRLRDHLVVATILAA